MGKNQDPGSGNKHPGSATLCITEVYLPYLLDYIFCQKVGKAAGKKKKVEKKVRRECAHCGRVFWRLISYLHHDCRSGRPQGTVACLACGKTFQEGKSIVGHYKSGASFLFTRETFQCSSDIHEVNRYTTTS
jgi:hypothetical protein